jgi:hypothetical protein
MVDCAQATEFAVAHWLVGGADGGRLFVRCFDAAMTVREDIAGDVLASLATVLWNVPAKAWTGRAVMAEASLNRRMTVRVAEAVASAQIGIVGFDGQIELEALRLYGLPSPPVRPRACAAPRSRGLSSLPMRSRSRRSVPQGIAGRRKRTMGRRRVATTAGRGDAPHPGAAAAARGETLGPPSAALWA